MILVYAHTPVHCDTCSQILHPDWDDAHWPHDPDCPQHGDCQCDTIVCPGCCPTCNPETAT